MGSGILCVDFYSVGQPVEAAVLLWFAAGTWLFLAAVLALRVLYEPARFAGEARSPAALTGVAGTGVLGTAFAVHGYYPVAAVMLGLAGVGWGLLLTPVLSHWETPVAGVSFLLTVATEGLAVLGATLAARNGAAWLLIAASAALILGLAFYIITVTRFAVGQLLTGRGDQWVAGGARGHLQLWPAPRSPSGRGPGRLTWMHGFLRRCRAGLVVPGHALARTADRGRGAARPRSATTYSAGPPSFRLACTRPASSAVGQVPESPGSASSPSMDLAGGHSGPVGARRSHPSQLARAAARMIPGPAPRWPGGQPGSRDRGEGAGQGPPRARPRPQRECGCQDQPTVVSTADH